MCQFNSSKDNKICYTFILYSAQGPLSIFGSSPPHSLVQSNVSLAHLSIYIFQIIIPELLLNISLLRFLNLSTFFILYDLFLHLDSRCRFSMGWGEALAAKGYLHRLPGHELPRPGEHTLPDQAPHLCCCLSPVG